MLPWIERLGNWPRISARRSASFQCTCIKCIRNFNIWCHSEKPHTLRYRGIYREVRTQTNACPPAGDLRQHWDKRWRDAVPRRAIACDVFTSENVSEDKDRKQGKSDPKMDEVDSKSEQHGCKTKVCSEGAREEICWRSFWLTEGWSVNPSIQIEKLVMPCSTGQKFGYIQKYNAYRNVEETRIFDPWLVWIVPKAIENERQWVKEWERTFRYNVRNFW